MKTNKEKYDILFKEYNEVVQNYVTYLFPNGLPKKLFTADGEKIGIKNVTRATISPSFYNKEKPTRTDIYNIKSFLGNRKVSDIYIFIMNICLLVIEPQVQKN